MVSRRGFRGWAAAGLSGRGRVVAVAVGISLLVGLGVVLAAGGVPGAGPADGTVTSTSVPDELPAGVVLEDAREVESTVAREGEALSAAVTYVVGRPAGEVLAAVEESLGAAGWEPRTSSSDDQTTRAVFDGPDAAVLTVTVRPVEDGTAVAAVLAR